ncbi:MAG: hypothetical protein ACRENE_00760, partial [Polyangiaceae bacterium]
MSKDRDGERERICAEADRVRADLLRTAGELDRRAHRAVALARGLPGDPQVVGALAAVAVAGVGLTAILSAVRLAEGSRTRWRARWRLLAEVWKHPDRARRSTRRSLFPLFEEALRSVAIALLATAVATRAKRALRGVPDAGTGDATSRAPLQENTTVKGLHG